MELIEAASHEFAANFVYCNHDLAPWFGADRCVKDGGGSVVADFETDGERWRAKLYYQQSGIVHPGMTTPQGTPVELEEIREFRIAVMRHPEEDSVGKQRFNARIAPRWQGMKVENKQGQESKLSIPDQLIEGVNVRVSGANIAFERYQALLREAAAAVGINGYYFREPSSLSNVLDAERYVRIDKDESGPIHGRRGPIASMAHLLEDDRDGYRKLVQNERDEHGRHLPGYYHTVTLGPKRVSAAFPDHRLPKEIKHYYAREAKSLGDSHPLAHPKLGASYQRSRWDEKVGVSPDELDELERELDETVMAVLEDAGLPLRPNGDDRDDDLATDGGAPPYVPDAYFRARSVDQDRNIVPLDLTEIRQEQENIVVKYLSENGGLSPVQEDAVNTLLADGGKVSPTQIAEENDRHVDSVYRALQAIPELVETAYGSVALKSDHTAELLMNALEDAKDAGERAVRTLGKTIAASKRGYREERRALVAYAELHGIDIHDRDSGVVVKMLREGDGDPATRIQRLSTLWEDAGKDMTRLRQAEIRFTDTGGLATLWRYLS